MAKRRRHPRRSDPQAPGWAWMLFGLGIGLVIAAGAYWRAGQAPQLAERPQPQARDSTSAAEEESRQASDAAAETAETRFDFYEILPKYEVVIPEVESAPKADRPQASVAEPGRYVLQAGSFRTEADADRMQATLALLGIESRIQRVTIDADVFHRVRVGPISDLDELNGIRERLREARIDALLMRVP